MQKGQDYSVHVLSQWEMTLHCNVISHWLGTCTKWSLKRWAFVWFSPTCIDTWGRTSCLDTTVISQPAKMGRIPSMSHCGNVSEECQQLDNGGRGWINNNFYKKTPWPYLNIKTVFPDIVTLIIKISWLWDYLIFILRIPTLGRWPLYIEMGPRLN